MHGDNIRGYLEMYSTTVDAPGRFFGSTLKHDDIKAFKCGLHVAGIFMLLPDFTCS
jgi:hypothetical protein